MDIRFLENKIISVHNEMQGQAKSAVNIMLTVRNWLIGNYIVEYEQNGSDRAKYGDKLLLVLAQNINIKGLSVTNLKLNREFYFTYSQIGQTVSDQLKLRTRIGQTVSDQLNCGTSSHDLSKHQQNTKLQILYEPFGKLSKQDMSQNTLSVPPAKLIASLSFSHFVELIKIKENLKRVFYELESINGTWSVRELKRQINSLYYERSGLSRNKEKLSKIANLSVKTQDNLATLRNPLVFEFLDLPINETLEESRLEKALMDNLQQFLLELGNGFCFEARQKRILIDDEYYYIDLVFYHRLLKCHVLVELKTESFTHENIGQLNVYLQYYKDKIMQENDNPPIGILLCTESKPQMVRYALADKEQMLVNQYKLQLPGEKELQQFIEKQLASEKQIL